MRVLCRHGHFAFYPKNAREISRFNSIFSIPLVRVNDFYTFALLEEALDYSLIGKPYLGVNAATTFAGNVWDVMRANGLVYDFTDGFLKLKGAILQIISLTLIDDFWVSDAPLVVPGGLTETGQKILSYDGELDLQTSQLRIFEVEYE